VLADLIGVGELDVGGFGWGEFAVDVGEPHAASTPRQAAAATAGMDARRTRVSARPRAYSELAIKPPSH
jgi:hypothetical protein